MMHITEEYGQPCNLLVLSEEEYRVLDAFLRLEGVRIRRCKTSGGEVKIKAVNPFMSWLAHCAGLDYPAKKAYEQAKDDMSDREVARYKYPELSLPTAMSASFANGTRAKTVRIWIEELDPTPEFIQWMLDTHTDAQWWKDNMSKLRGSDDWEMLEELAAEWKATEAADPNDANDAAEEETTMAKTYTVILNHWVDGSGWSHSETFDRIAEPCTAEEYVRSLDTPLDPPTGCDDTFVQICDGENCISEAWVSDVQ